MPLLHADHAWTGSATAPSSFDRMYATPASLDSVDCPPSGHVSFEEHVPWLDVRDDLPKYRGNGLEKLEG